MNKCHRERGRRSVNGLGGVTCFDTARRLAYNFTEVACNKWGDTMGQRFLYSLSLPDRRIQGRFCGRAERNADSVWDAEPVKGRISGVEYDAVMVERVTATGGTSPLSVGAEMPIVAGNTACEVNVKRPHSSIVTGIKLREVSSGNRHVHSLRANSLVPRRLYSLRGVFLCK